MSDFDKEAEREKLRKKFADDEEKRADTRRMSELLLKGATMTNKHCNQCSDPLFRYNGQTFCPSCQANGGAPEAGSDADAAGQSEANSENHQAATESQQPPTPGETADAPENGEEPPASHGEPSGQPDPQANRPQQSQPQTNRSRGNHSPTTQPRTEQSPPERHQNRQSAAATGSPGEAGDLTEARQSLTRTVTRFARAAESTDDPRRARDLLAAAREAAATLSELE